MQEPSNNCRLASARKIFLLLIPKYMISNSIKMMVLFFVCCTPSHAQTPNAEETNLYNLVMQHRRKIGLPAIPLSPSLTFVAQTHARDLIENKPDVGECNLHSWSAKGKWPPCCYTSDHANVAGIWSKPGELTSYTASGYEIAYWSSGGATAANALKSWQSSPGHIALIENTGLWSKSDWKAIGIAVNEGYALIWFGKEPEPK